MGLGTTVRRRMVAAVEGDSVAAVVDRGVTERLWGDRDLVLAYQRARGLRDDGVAGPITLSALWRESPPQASEVVMRALAALAWPTMRYSMSVNAGLGERWVADPDIGYPVGDCSDFVCHCMGLPKDQTKWLAAPLVRGACWLGADALAGDAVGEHYPIEDALPGDLIVFSGRWERGERVAIGHVEVCVEVDLDGGRVRTIGVASNNRPSAVGLRDKTARWRARGAIAVRPRWYQ